MEIEVWMLVLTGCCAVVPWAFSIHAKVAVIASAVENLPEVVDELRDVLREHEERLNEHAEEIQALKNATTSRR